MSTPAFRAFAILLLVLSTAGCGGGGADSATPPTSSTVGPLLPEPGNALIRSVLPNASAAPADPQEIRAGHILSRLDVFFDASATVAQYNAVALAAGATGIAASRAGIPVVSMQIAQQPGIAALRALAVQLRAMPGVIYATPARTLGADVLAGETDSTPGSKAIAQHLLISRFPQAWNARTADGVNCSANKVTVIAFDVFGHDNVLRPDFRTKFDQTNFVRDPDVATLDPSDPESGHGYDVTMVLGGKFDTTAPTGAQPFEDCLKVVQAEAGGRSTADALLTLWDRIQGSGSQGKFILNASLGFRSTLCGPTADQPCDAQTLPLTPPAALKDDIAQRVLMAAFWKSLAVIDPTLHTRMLIVASAGNIEEDDTGFLSQIYRGFRDSRFNSPFTLSTHISALDSMLADASLWTSSSIPNAPDLGFSPAEIQQLRSTLVGATGVRSSATADNLLVADSASCGGGQAGECGEDLAAVGQSVFNFLGGAIRAVGEQIVFDGARLNGTSYAAPQVAGLAALMLAASPEMRNAPLPTLVSILTATGTPVSVNAVPLIDAYAAMLALDSHDPSGSRRVRKALLDVNGDGVFDHLDLLKFEAAYRLGDPSAPTIPASRDFSRYDLNGDGATGGIPTRAFDLDVNTPPFAAPMINTVTYRIPLLGGSELPVTLNEAAVNDLEILCYYAYSNLYTGDTALRADILRPERCLRVQMTLSLAGVVAPASATISGTAPVQIVLTQPNGQGGFSPLVNAPVQLTAACGSLGGTTGQTDSNGRFETNVTPNSGCTSITVTAQVEGTQSNQPVVRQSVSANVGTAGASSLSGRLVAASGPPTGATCLKFVDLDGANGGAVNCDQTSLTVSMGPGGLTVSSAVAGTSDNPPSEGMTGFSLRITLPTPAQVGAPFTVRAQIMPAWFGASTGNRQATIRNACSGTTPQIIDGTATYRVVDDAVLENDLNFEISAGSFGGEPGHCLIDVTLTCSGFSGRSCAGSGVLFQISVQ